MSGSSIFICERCGGKLAPDDAVSIIEGLCGPCRFATTEIESIASEGLVESGRTDADPPPSALDDLVRADDHSLRQQPRRPREVETEPVLHSPRIVPAPFAPARKASPKVRGRARDLVIGVSIGLVLTFAVTAYILFSRSASAPQLADAPQLTAETVTVRVD